MIAFESCVNPEGYKATAGGENPPHPFESCVNPEGYKASMKGGISMLKFESCVNPEGYKAVYMMPYWHE